MSLLTKTQLQLKAAQFQFRKLFENNRVLCEAIITAEEALKTAVAQDNTAASEALEKIRELKERLQ